jgi:hypothetical protein
VDYATITLSLEEVYRFSNVPETPKSYPQLLGSAFVEGLEDFAEWLEDITVSLAYSWTWLALIALIAFAVVKVAKRRRGGADKPKAPHGIRIPRVGLGLKKPNTADAEPKETKSANADEPQEK